ncbi:MAG: hypothetical protein RUDDFDWM_000350 [Candidatus Fervidibacterota bacterium]
MRRECKKARKYMSLMLDGEITRSALKWFEAHINRCVACRAELRALQVISQAIRSEGRVKAPIDVSEHIAPMLWQVHPAETTRRQYLKPFLLPLAFSLSLLLAVCCIWVRWKSNEGADVARMQIPPVYVHAHLLNADQAQVFLNPMTNLTIVEASSWR